MARRSSYRDVEGRASVSQDQVAGGMVALSVEEKPGDWDPATKTTSQRTDAAGTPQWLLNVLFTPVEGDRDHGPEVVPVTLTAQTRPVIQAGKPVRFVNLTTWTYLKRTKDGHVTGAGRSFAADGFRQGEAH